MPALIDVKQIVTDNSNLNSIEQVTPKLTAVLTTSKSTVKRGLKDDQKVNSKLAFINTTFIKKFPFIKFQDTTAVSKSNTFKNPEVEKNKSTGIITLKDVPFLKTGFNNKGYLNQS